MKNIIFLFILLIAFNCYGDELQQPFTCYPKKVQDIFNRYDLKVDLYPENRVPDSWGFLRSYGDHFSIFTYKKLNKKEISLAIKIMKEYIKEVENQ